MSAAGGSPLHPRSVRSPLVSVPVDGPAAAISGGSHREETDVVSLDVRVATDERQSFALCLGHEHAIERVAVDQRQSARGDRMVKRDG